MLTAISDRAEVELPTLGDSMVVSLLAAGTADSPRWSAFYSELLDDEEWSRVDEFASWHTSMMDLARRYKQYGHGHPDSDLDEFVMPPVSPFLPDSPMLENVPMVAPVGGEEHRNFWPRNLPVPQLWLGSLTISPVDILTDRVSADWIREATGRQLIDMASGTKSFINVVDELTEFDPAFKKAVQAIEARANDFFSLMGTLITAFRWI
ncbi:hypothetical protein EU811_00815 [Arthrobacter sp. TS-15]|nr:hypothetical protein EU811_00815 [Arthrobacter sp. TS-15]